MGDFYKTCDIHGKPFPHNQVDTRKTKMFKLYAEKKDEIEGTNVKLALFVDKQAENEGIDVCANCMQEKVNNLLTATDNNPAWKGITWHEVTKTKKDGSTYTRNESTVESIEEITQRLKNARQQQAVAPTTK